MAGREGTSSPLSLTRCITLSFPLPLFRSHSPSLCICCNTLWPCCNVPQWPCCAQYSLECVCGSGTVVGVTRPPEALPMRDARLTEPPPVHDADPLPIPPPFRPVTGVARVRAGLVVGFSATPPPVCVVDLVPTDCCCVPEHCFRAPAVLTWQVRGVHVGELRRVRWRTPIPLHDHWLRMGVRLRCQLQAVSSYVVIARPPLLWHHVG